MTECFPIFKGAVYNTTVPANTNFFATDLLPSNTPTTFLIYYYPTSGTVTLPRLKRINGSNTMIESFNAQATAASYMFQTIVGPGDSINLTTQQGDTCAVTTLIVIEIQTTTGNVVFNLPRMG